MRNTFMLAIAALFFTQTVLADEPQTFDSKACATIASACKDAGYTKHNGKREFWLNCMKPVVMGKTVEGVTVDAAIVKQCRTDKVMQLKRELKELQQ